MHAGLGRLDGIVLIMDRRGGAGEVINLVDLHIERKGNVMPHQFETWMAYQMFNIMAGSSKEIIRAEYLIATIEQALA